MGKIQEAINKVRQPRGNMAGALPQRRSIDKQDGQAGPTAKSRLSLTQFFRPIFFDDADLKRFRVLNDGAPKNVVSAYKMLRTRLLHRIRANNWSSIAITSASPGDGKTLTAINLAISLAEEANQNIFLIDLDMRNPSVNKYLAVENNSSIVNFFNNPDADIGDFVFRSQTECLYIIGNNEEGIQNSSELIFSSRMTDLLASLNALDPRGIFLFDLPPILAVDDMLAFAPHADAVLLVVGEGGTSRENLASANELIKSTQLNIAGIILNRSVDAVKTGYY